MRILITGAAGMLADAVITELEEKGNEVFDDHIEIMKADINVRLPDIARIDVRKADETAEWIIGSKADFVFHFAAETDVDLCEKQPDYAYRANYAGTENVAIVCQKHDIPMLYISTGAVFPGEKVEPYSEFDPPGPANVYGYSKYYGEIVVQRLLRRYFIVRAGWMVGGWELDKKFVYKIVRQLQEGKKELKAVNDRLGSPTFTVDFAKNLLPLLKTGRYGLYHMANKGTASRFDIAQKIVNFLGLAAEVTVSPVCSAEFPLPAPRGRSEMIRNHHLDLIEMNNMPCWEDSLKTYLLSNVKRTP